MYACECACVRVSVCVPHVTVMCVRASVRRINVIVSVCAARANAARATNMPNVNVCRLQSSVEILLAFSLRQARRYIISLYMLSISPLPPLSTSRSLEAALDLLPPVAEIDTDKLHS